MHLLFLLSFVLFLLSTHAAENCLEYDTVTVSVSSNPYGARIVLSGSVDTLHEIEVALPAPLRLFLWDQVPSLALVEGRLYTTVDLSIMMPAFCDCWYGSEKELASGYVVRSGGERPVVSDAMKSKCIDPAFCQAGVVPVLFQATMLKLGFNMHLLPVTGAAQGYSRCLKK